MADPTPLPDPLGRSLRIQPNALTEAAARFGAMAATVEEARGHLTAVAASCRPVLVGAVGDAAEASSRGAGQALQTLSENYATLGRAMAAAAAHYPRVDGQVFRP